MASVDLRAADPGSSCPIAPGARVRIYELNNGVDLVLHLCLGCLTALKWAGWTVRMNRTPPFDDFRCDCCEKGIVRVAA